MSSAISCDILPFICISSTSASSYAKTKPPSVNHPSPGISGGAGLSLFEARLSRWICITHVDIKSLFGLGWRLNFCNVCMEILQICIVPHTKYSRNVNNKYVSWERRRHSVILISWSCPSALHTHTHSNWDRLHIRSICCCSLFSDIRL